MKSLRTAAMADDHSARWNGACLAQRNGASLPVTNFCQPLLAVPVAPRLPASRSPACSGAPFHRIPRTLRGIGAGRRPTLEVAIAVWVRINITPQALPWRWSLPEYPCQSL